VVKAGDPLFELDPSDQDAAIAAASAQVQAATARVAAARANLLETQQVANRELALSSAGVGTRGAAEDTAARVTAMAEQVKAAEADTKAARAQMGAMQVNRGNYIITAPVSGTIVTKPPELGEFLGPQPAGLAVDMGGVEIADFATLMVETDVPEAKLGMIKMGGPAEIVLDAYAQKRFRGKAVEVTPESQPNQGDCCRQGSLCRRHGGCTSRDERAREFPGERAGCGTTQAGPEAGGDQQCRSNGGRRKGCLDG
jgi:HlyD family secretion protein